jgi:predicted TIM-barrel fold metal-dependent hydrolase
MTKPCQGPDPDTQIPATSPPPLACDTHAHIIGPYSRFPLSPRRGYTAPEAPVDMYRKMLATLGVERSVIVNVSAHGSDNSVTLDALQQLEGRARGIAILVPDISDAEVQKLVDGGMVGLRLSTLSAGGYGTNFLDSAIARARDLGWLIQLHLRSTDELIALAPKLSVLDIDILIDHLGRPDCGAGVSAPGFQILLSLLRDSDNFWVKICSWYRLSASGAPYEDMRPFADALMAARPDRLVWGSNWPHPNFRYAMPNDGVLLDQFMNWAGDGRLRKMIFSDNPARLFGFD